jgi:hypothetical protein
MSANDEIQIKLDLSDPIMTRDEQLVWDVLRMCKGKPLAILGPEIEALTSIPYKRVQKIINDLRCHHARLIGSGTCGYYLPQTRQEMDEVTRYIRHRAIMALYTVSRLMKTSMQEVYGQAVIEFNEGNAEA